MKENKAKSREICSLIACVRVLSLFTKFVLKYEETFLLLFHKSRNLQLKSFFRFISKIRKSDFRKSDYGIYDHSCIIRTSSFFRNSRRRWKVPNKKILRIEIELWYDHNSLLYHHYYIFLIFQKLFYLSFYFLFFIKECKIEIDLVILLHHFFDLQYLG